MLIRLLPILGSIGGQCTNKLFYLTVHVNRSEWSETFPPMPTRRRRTIALCSKNTLLVAGGYDGGGKMLRTVEIMNTDNKTWSTAAKLPQALCVASATVIGDHLYILGGAWELSSYDEGTNAVYTCSLSALLKSRRDSASSGDVWRRIADLPVTWATCVSVQNRILAVGGKQPEESRAIHMYDPGHKLWQKISEMSVPREQCFATVLPNRVLMVVGGWSDGRRTNSIELASITTE